MLQRLWLADLDPRGWRATAARAGRAAPDAGRPGLPLRLGRPRAGCRPTSATSPRRSCAGPRGRVLAPADDEDALPDYVTSAGKPVAVRYNGSVAKINFGPAAAARARRWIRDGEFDVLHVHEPVGPSLSMLAIWAATGPIVATWHSSCERSRRD